MNIDSLTEEITDGTWDSLLADIYEADIEFQKTRYVEALGRFRECYGNRNVSVFCAPGRTEIGGNHTDHQHGQVLAAAVNLDALGVASINDKQVIRVTSEGYEEIEVFLEDLTPQEWEKETSAALIRGILKGFTDYGYKIGGFDAYITSDVLVGAGLSSSAAYEVLIGTIISGLYNDMSVPPVDTAKIGQFAENIYFGKPCGLMDQTASACGNVVHIDFANPHEPGVELVDFPLSEYGYSLCITDTKGSHVDLTADYGAVPAEMKSVARYFGQEVMLGITVDMIHKNIQDVRGKLGDRAVLRAIHFITENQRVIDEVEAIRKGDMVEFLKVFRESGDSSYKYLQNIYSSQDVQHQNVSVAIAFSDMFLGKEGASRVHGGGFAGTMQAFVKDYQVEEYKAYMDTIFGQGSCMVLKIRKYGGMKVM